MTQPKGILARPIMIPEFGAALSLQPVLYLRAERNSLQVLLGDILTWRLPAVSSMVYCRSLLMSHQLLNKQTVQGPAGAATRLMRRSGVSASQRSGRSVSGSSSATVISWGVACSLEMLVRLIIKITTQRVCSFGSLLNHKWKTLTY